VAKKGKTGNINTCNCAFENSTIKTGKVTHVIGFQKFNVQKQETPKFHAKFFLAGNFFSLQAKFL
jgi:hypothetical protein